MTTRYCEIGLDQSNTWDFYTRELHKLFAREFDNRLLRDLYMNESLTNDELNGAWQVETSAPMITHWVSDIGMTNLCAIFPVTMLVLHMILEWLIYTWYIPDSSIRDTLDDLSGGNCCANPPLWASPCLRTTKDLSDQQRPAVLAQKRHFLEREKAPKSLRRPFRLNSRDSDAVSELNESPKKALRSEPTRVLAVLPQ